MNMDYPAGAFFKSEQASSVDRRAAKKAATEANWRTVCRQVDKRDRHRCRACGVACDPDALDMLGRAHRHHLTFRSKGGQDVASNLATLCSRCHDAIHVKRTLRLEVGQYGGDGPLEVWRRIGDDDWFMSRREVSVHQVEKD